MQASFDGEHLEQLARSLGFVRRSDGKLTAEKFLMALLYCASIDECSSLENMCAVLRELCSIEIRKQSLDERFSKGCLNFIKSVLQEVLSANLFANPLYKGSFWAAFTKVSLKDSTKFKVPDTMSDEFKGNGGSSSGLCIQFEYDLKTGEILDMSVTSGGGNDRTDAKLTSDRPSAGELVLRDLGYYSLDVFLTFIENGAYFLSKLYPKTVVYIKDSQGKEQRVDFEALYQKMLQKGTEMLELDVTLGEQHKIPVRLILSLADEEDYEKRVRERKKENSKRGQTLSKETLIRFRFNAYITNASREQLPVREIFSAYRLRWQIELTFKIWKSTYKLHVGRKMKKERFLVMIYTKLILIVINLSLTRALQSQLNRRECRKGSWQLWQLSTFKVMATLRKKFYRCTYALFFGGVREKDSVEILFELQTHIAQNHWLDVRKDKNNINNINTLII